MVNQASQFLVSFILLLAMKYAWSSSSVSCKDRVSNCATLVKHYDCSGNQKDYMRKSCRKTCGRCDICEDRDKGCSIFAASLGCNGKDRVFMHGTCPKTCNTCKSVKPGLRACGLTKVVSTNIVSGKWAKQGAWPWMALLLKSGRSFCGGTLVASNWVVTAAHCVVSISSSSYSSVGVVLGEHNQDKNEGTEQVMAIKDIIIHPKYNDKDLFNDIALIKLKKPATLNAAVNTVCFPQQNKTPSAFDTCYTTGWGRAKTSGKMVQTLQQLAMPVVKRFYCLGKSRVNSQIVCAGYSGKNPPSTCKGDSGGPLVCQDKATKAWVLHGVTSYGEIGCVGYTAFAAVNKHIAWINKNVV